jgi:hypothetical protein
MKAAVAALALAVVGLGVFLLSSMRRPAAPATAEQTGAAPATVPAPDAPSAAALPSLPSVPSAPTDAPGAARSLPPPIAAARVTAKGLEWKGVGKQMAALNTELDQQREVLDRQQRGEQVDPEAVKKANQRIWEIQAQIRHLRGELTR